MMKDKKANWYINTSVYVHACVVGYNSETSEGNAALRFFLLVAAMMGLPSDDGVQYGSQQTKKPGNWEIGNFGK